MSSQYSSLFAENCIDGDFYTICHTKNSHSPWLSVQLDATDATVTGVEVDNPRYTTYQTPAALATVWGRLGDFEVWVGAVSGE